MIDFLHHLFLPRESNNHRAKLLHHSSLLVLIIGLFVLGSGFSFTARHNQAVLGISYSITPQDLLIMTNQKRQEAGMPLLVMNDSLTQAATRKAQDMFAKNYWAHIAPDGTTPWYFIKSSGYEYIYAGENLARGFYSTGDVVSAWMASPSHRENVLSPNYKDVGFAIQGGSLTGDETVLVVQEFGSTRSTTTVVQTEPAPQVTPLVPSVTPVVVAVNLPTPTPTAIPIQSPTPIVTQVPILQEQVAAFRNDPLINKPQAQKSIALFIILGLLVLLILDILITRKRGITRILSHNIDHVIFFGILLIIIILITKGGIL